MTLLEIVTIFHYSAVNDSECVNFWLNPVFFRCFCASFFLEKWKIDSVLSFYIEWKYEYIGTYMNVGNVNKEMSKEMSD